MFRKKLGKRVFKNRGYLDIFKIYLTLLIASWPSNFVVTVSQARKILSCYHLTKKQSDQILKVLEAYGLCKRWMGRVFIIPKISLEESYVLDSS